MQLLVITIDDCDEFLATLEGLRAHGMNGIVFQSTSLKHALLNSNVAVRFGGPHSHPAVHVVGGAGTVHRHRSEIGGEEAADTPVHGGCLHWPGAHGFRPSFSHVSG